MKTKNLFLSCMLQRTGRNSIKWKSSCLWKICFLALTFQIIMLFVLSINCSAEPIAVFKTTPTEGTAPLEVTFTDESIPS